MATARIALRRQFLQSPEPGDFGTREIPQSRPYLGKAESDAVAQVLLSGQIAQGPVVEGLESDWCAHTHKKHAAAVGSGVGALRLALLSLGIGPGDEVVVPAYSCVALMNAVLALGAVPVLADVAADRWVLMEETVRAVLCNKTKAIVAVHLFGAPAPIHELLSFGVPVIEDCAHGVDGRIGEAWFGSLGTLNVSSFYATKLIAGGEGGIVAGNDGSVIEIIRKARNYSDQDPNGLNLNDKLTDIEAALARVQLSKLQEIIQKRHALAMRYTQVLHRLQQSGVLVTPLSDSGRIWYRYVVQLVEHKAVDICLRSRMTGIHIDQPVWDIRTTPIWEERLVTTSLAFDRLISLPLYPDLSEKDQDAVCGTLSTLLGVRS